MYFLLQPHFEAFKSPAVVLSSNNRTVQLQVKRVASDYNDPQGHSGSKP